jgi:hypothetical protein
MAWRKRGKEYISYRDAQKEASRINKSPNMKARVKTKGRGRTRVVIDGKGYMGKKNKDGTITLNTVIVEVNDKPMKSKSRRK